MRFLLRMAPALSSCVKVAMVENGAGERRLADAARSVQGQWMGTGAPVTGPTRAVVSLDRVQPLLQLSNEAHVANDVGQLLRVVGLEPLRGRCGRSGRHRGRSLVVDGSSGAWTSVHLGGFLYWRRGAPTHPLHDPLSVHRFASPTRQMITSTIHSIVASAQPAREDFYAADGTSPTVMNNGWAMAVALITLVIIILLLSLIGECLWNSCVCGAGSAPACSRSPSVRTTSGKSWAHHLGVADVRRLRVRASRVPLWLRPSERGPLVV